MSCDTCYVLSHLSPAPNSCGASSWKGLARPGHCKAPDELPCQGRNEKSANLEDKRMCSEMASASMEKYFSYPKPVQTCPNLMASRPKSVKICNCGITLKTPDLNSPPATQMPNGLARQAATGIFRVTAAKAIKPRLASKKNKICLKRTSIYLRVRTEVEINGLQFPTPGFGNSPCVAPSVQLDSPMLWAETTSLSQAANYNDALGARNALI